METQNTNSLEDLPILQGTATVELIVNNSSILIEVNGSEAPITAGNFVDLVERGVYDNVPFHRVIREPEPFVVQGGDPQGKDPNFPIDRLGTGGFIDPETGLERNIPLEIKLTGDDEPTYSQAELPGDSVILQHEPGAIAMARSNQPDSASSQFYFALDELHFLDGNYAVFGQVTEGFDVVNEIEQGDRIEDAEVISGLDNLILNNDDIDEENYSVYRFLNTDTGAHFYTVSEVERENILTNLPNFNSEGIAFSATPQVDNDLLTGVTPVYRMLNRDTGVHLYTIYEEERENILENLPNYNDEGIAYYAYETPQEGAIPLYRYLNTDTAAHFYTSAVGEKEFVDANLSNLVPEGNEDGIGYWVLPTPVDSIV